jgi:hypothetical protein
MYPVYDLILLFNIKNANILIIKNNCFDFDKLAQIFI